jgi:DNA-binding XRE family transcriptional regulator
MDTFKSSMAQRGGESDVDRVNAPAASVAAAGAFEQARVGSVRAAVPAGGDAPRQPGGVDDDGSEQRDRGTADAEPAGRVRGAGLQRGVTQRTSNSVRRLREERMMSKAELARRAGLSTLTIDRLERGMSCRMDTKRKILEALGLGPQDRTRVFGDEGESTGHALVLDRADLKDE